MECDLRKSDYVISPLTKRLRLKVKWSGGKRVHSCLRSYRSRTVLIQCEKRAPFFMKPRDAINCLPYLSRAPCKKSRIYEPRPPPGQLRAENARPLANYFQIFQEFFAQKQSALWLLFGSYYLFACPEMAAIMVRMGKQASRCFRRYKCVPSLNASCGGGPWGNKNNTDPIFVRYGGA